MLVDQQEFALQKSLIFSTTREKGSNYTRYSAAMYFYMLGMLSAELLEIYRRCCKFDHEDPQQLAIHEGIEIVLKDDLVFTSQRPSSCPQKPLCP